MKFSVCFLLAFGALASFPQQPPPLPVDGLNSLSFMKGDWAGQQVFNTNGGPAMVGEATDRIEIGIGGKYLCETLSTTLPGRKPTDTRHFISYDKQSGRYTAWWFNDTGIRPTELSGEVTGNKLVLLSSPSAAGPVLRAAYVRTADDKLTYQVEMKQSDAWTSLFVTTYSKRAGSQ